MIKRIVLLLLFLAVFRLAEDFCHRKTRGFTLLRIQAESVPGQAAVSPSEPVKRILDQKFTYFADGKQSFVFLSADGQYVLKFFKRASSFPPAWTSTVPVLNWFKPFRAAKIAQNEEKRKRDYEGYDVAFRRAASETGLVWVQLSNAPGTLPTIPLVDILGIEHKLDLNRAHFVLQKRATPVYQLMRQWTQNGETEKLREAIFALLDFCRARAEKGIYDDDAAFYKNFAFLEGKVVQVDPGQYQERPSFADAWVQQQDTARVMRRFKRWLEWSYPELIPYVDEYAANL